MEYPHNYPGYLFRHSAALYNNKMYIFGGLKKILENTNEMRSFNFSTQKWDIIEFKGELEPPKIDSHAVIVHDDIMYVFGGFISSKKGDYSKEIFMFDLNS